MDLFIVRHAWAFDRDHSRWPNDDKRPLTEDGSKRFAEFVKKLTRRGFSPQVIATSPLVRCVQTAEILSTALPNQVRIEEIDDLCPESDLAGILQWTAGLGKDIGAVAWVGHAPDVGLMTAELIGASEGQIRFAKGAIAAIHFEDRPARQIGELQWLATAKILGC